MKRVVMWMMFLCFLTGCSRTEDALPGEKSRFHQDFTAVSEETMYLQRNLAQWYNVNLLYEYEPGFRDAYGEILFFSDGVMAALEIEKLGSFPVYHGDGLDGTVGHDPDSAFPIGGVGNHVVLTVSDWELEKGDIFRIHILNETLDYEIIAVRSRPDCTPVPGMDLCSLITDGGKQYLAVRVEGCEQEGGEKE